MPQLSPAARRTLKSRAHHLRPYLSVGEAGLTSPLLKEIDVCLKSHELIKVRVLVGDRHDRGRLIEEICRELGAFPVQHIGKILVIFRPRPEQPATRPTPPPAKKDERRHTSGRRHRLGKHKEQEKSERFRRT